MRSGEHLPTIEPIPPKEAHHVRSVRARARSEHRSLDATAGLCWLWSVEVCRFGVLPVAVQHLDLLGQYACDGEFRQVVDGVPGHFAGLVAHEVGIYFA